MRPIAKKKINYYLFLQQNSIVAPVIDVVRRTITPEDNQLLTKYFTKEEFRLDMFSMHMTSWL
jgi:hypothetical protein